MSDSYDYFCDNCLHFWRHKKNFMPGCDTCAAMSVSDEWGNNVEQRASNAAAIWGPIIDYCNEHGKKAFVVPGNKYHPRLNFNPALAAVAPTEQGPFYDDQRLFVRMYNAHKSKRLWNLLHPSTQLLSLPKLRL